ncbi:MAG: hypothetical protein COA57_05715 [Flavobacteriales bacterium]|nr:MAG: hypothetical protein COA57_05715 [Flavobacteriales bacterium]
MIALKQLIRSIQQRPAFATLLMLPVYFVFHTVFFQVFYEGRLGFSQTTLHIDFANQLHESYYSFSILANYLSVFVPAFVFALLLLPLCLFYRKIKWNQIEAGNYFRWFVLAITAVLLWFLESYDYNYYIDNGHEADRLLLLVLALLVFYHPLFVSPFTVLALLFRSQFDFPVGGFPLFDIRLLFDLLIMFYCYLLFRIIFNLRAVNLLLLTCCLLASNYFFSGVKKLFNSPFSDTWAVSNNLGDLLTNCSLRGWPVSNGVISFANEYSVLLQLIVIAIELSALFILFRKKVSIFILLGIIIMHESIFALTGLFFWKWMLVDAALIALLLLLPKNFLDELFSKSNFRLSLCIIAIAFFFFSPLKISWHDTPFTQFFSYEAVGESGKIYPMNKNDFKPFDQYFQYDALLYLVNESLLPVSGFGYTPAYQTARAIRQTNSEKIGEVEKTLGKNYFDEQKANDFDSFIRKYFKTLNKRMEKHTVNLIAAPAHVMHAENQKYLQPDEKVVQLRVIFVKYFNVKGKPVKLEEKTIRQINI